MCSYNEPRVPRTRSKRALGTGNLTLVVATATELLHVGPRDALEVCVLLRDGDLGPLWPSASLLAGRFALEAPAVTSDAIEVAVAALNALPDRPADAMDRLARLCVEHRVV